jgi:predicted nuclease of predicted toxin-antitoxin system
LSIKLLLDENLSERLLPLLSESFPGSTHIRLLGLGGVDDRAVWEEARASGSVLLTKDDDFLAMSMSLGWPPKVICLAIGNASNAATAQLILSRVSEIGYFHEHPEAGFLLLKPASGI